MVEISLLRTCALLAGATILVVAAYRLRRYRGERTATLLAAIGGIALVLLGAFPALANLPASIFSLGDQQGGRLITLLILAVIVLWFTLVWNRTKIAWIDQRQDRLLRALARERVFEPTNARATQHREALWVLIPALDEEATLPTLLSQIPRHAANHPVVIAVIDDGSTDNTQEVARELGSIVVSLPVNAGGGLALRAGFELALERDARWVVTMDADGQHDPHELPQLVQPLADERADVVIGSRQLGHHEPATTARKWGIRVFNVLISRLLGVKVTDCASGYRAMTADALRQLHLRQAQYHTAELLIDAAKRGLRIVEVPITIRRRSAGTTKKGADLAYGAMFLRTIIKTWLR